MKKNLFLILCATSIAMYGQPSFAVSDILSDDESLAVHSKDTSKEKVPTQPSVKPKLKRALGCDTQLFLTEDPILPNTYEASQQIIATGNVTSGTVNLRAGNEVLLEQEAGGGFEVQLGATLEVSIGPCTF